MSILVAVVAGFASGISLRSLFYFDWEPVVFVLMMAALIGAFAFMKPRRAYTLGAVFFIFVALGMGRSAIADTPAPEAFTRDLKHRVSYDAVVVGDPDIREKSQRIAVEVISGEDKVGMLAVMPLSARVAVGDRVRVYGTLSLPQAFETDGGRTFRYDKYLQARNVRFLLQFGTIYTREPAPWYSVPAALAHMKHTFLDGLNRALPNPPAALAGGIVIGGKQGLGTELQDAFTRSGLVQIIVLSGYNVMIVAEWVMAFLALLLLPRRLQYFAGGAALLLFVGIAGISATAVRAAIMAVIALYARATGRSYAASRALLFTVFLMIVWNPLYLCFDPGFGLSVAATAGIIWLSPIIEARLTRLRPFLKNAVATTLAAQISVLPLLLYNIGLFSLVALPANLLVNPLMPLAMASAAIAGVVGMTIGPFVPIIATIVGYPALILMRYLIFIAEKSSALPYAAFTIARFPFLLVLAAYVALVWVVASKRFSTTDQFKFAKKAST
ncbi:MAG: ComEC family competence protein [Patescibacteria group bacterium]|nr:ComEC family competence protein [Patescibacteria group bacterium]